MYTCGNVACGLMFQSRASSSCTWMGVPIEGDWIHSATRRSESQSTEVTVAPPVWV